MGLLMVCYEALHGILTGLARSTDHPRGALDPLWGPNNTGLR